MASMTVLPDPHEEDRQDIVEGLEMILEKAKNGEIDAYAIAYVENGRRDPTACHIYNVGNNGYAYVLFSALIILKDEMSEWIRGHYDDTE